jgi:imidazole glycerol phosphate synthase subunit HisF
VLGALDVGRARGHGNRLWPRRLRTIARAVDMPVIAAGNMGCAQDGPKAAVADAVAFADILPYGRSDIAARRRRKARQCGASRTVPAARGVRLSRP